MAGCLWRTRVMRGLWPGGVARVPRATATHVGRSRSTGLDPTAGGLVCANAGPASTAGEGRRSPMTPYVQRCLSLAVGSVLLLALSSSVQAATLVEIVTGLTNWASCLDFRIEGTCGA